MIKFTGDNIQEVLEYIRPLLIDGWNISYTQSLMKKEIIIIMKNSNTVEIEAGRFIDFDSNNGLVVYDKESTILVPVPDNVIEFERLINILFGESVRLQSSIDIISDVMDIKLSIMPDDKIKIGDYMVDIKYDDDSERIICHNIQPVENNINKE